MRSWDSSFDLKAILSGHVKQQECSTPRKPVGVHSHTLGWWLPCVKLEFHSEQNYAVNPVRDADIYNFVDDILVPVRPKGCNGNLVTPLECLEYSTLAMSNQCYTFWNIVWQEVSLHLTITDVCGWCPQERHSLQLWTFDSRFFRIPVIFL